MCYRGVPFAQAQAAIRHPSASLRSATVNTAPVCVTCLPCTLNVIVAGTATYALSPVDFMELDNLGSAESFTITANRRPGVKFSV